MGRFDFENPLEVARRLSKTRSLSICDFRRKQKEDHPRICSDSDVILRRKHSAEYYENEHSKLTNKVKEWLSNASSEIDKEDILDRKISTTSIEESLASIPESNDESPGEYGDSRKISEVSQKSIDWNLPAHLSKEILMSGCEVDNVPWETTNINFLLQVNNVLFPVDRNFITYVSDYFHKVLENAKLNGGNIFFMEGYEVDEVRTVLQFIHSVKNDSVSDENVASFLQLGKEFGVSRLIFQCESYLKQSITFNPFIMLHLSKQYKLESLLDHSIKEISKIENVECSTEFYGLDCDTQNNILKYILQRYRKASKTLSQFDVHLCAHHGDERKNNVCCYRAATYMTENERTFLVRMENPEKKLVQAYEKAFNCD